MTQQENIDDAAAARDLVGRADLHAGRAVGLIVSGAQVHATLALADALQAVVVAVRELGPHLTPRPSQAAALVAAAQALTRPQGPDGGPSAGVWLAPDCRDGKHAACSSQAWDEDEDRLTGCACCIAGHDLNDVVARLIAARGGRS